MISSTLRNWQQENRFRTGGDAVYGVYQSVGFSAVDEDGGKLFVFMLSGSDSAYDTMEDMLAAQGGALNRVQVGDVENYLALFFDESGEIMAPAMMTSLLDFVAANYRSAGFKAPNVCVKCGAPANKRSFLNNMVQPMCAQCREAEKSSGSQHSVAYAGNDAVYGGETLMPQRASYDESYDEYAGMENQPRYQMPAYDSNYMSSGSSEAPAASSGGRGFLGAVLGAVAGLVPYYISVLLNFELAALCFLAGIGAVLGFLVFGYGTVNDSGRVKSSLVSVFLWPGLFSVLSVLFVALMEHARDNMVDTFAYFAANIPWLNLAMAIIGVILGVRVMMK